MTLKSLIAKTRCHFFGHARGKSIGLDTTGKRMCYACPRCNASWTRPVKAGKKLKAVA